MRIRLHLVAVCLVVMAAASCGSSDQAASDGGGDPVAAESSPALASELQSYLDTNFSGTSWYSSIVSTDVVDGSAVAIINNAGDASAICGALSGWVYANDGPSEVSGVRVEGAAEVERSDISESC